MARDGVTFTSIIEEAQRGWPARLPVPVEVADRFVKDNKPQRVVCTLGKTRFSCAVMSHGAARFIHLSARLRTDAAVAIGDEVKVTLAPDKSPMGMELPPELEAVLEQEPKAAKRFMALTPGRRRGIAALVLRVKSSEGRAEKAVAILRAVERGTTDLRELARAKLIEPEDGVPRRVVKVGFGR